jgi:hypothetical protein
LFKADGAGTFAVSQLHRVLRRSSQEQCFFRLMTVGIRTVRQQGRDSMKRLFITCAGMLMVVVSTPVFSATSLQSVTSQNQVHFSPIRRGTATPARGPKQMRSGTTDRSPRFATRGPTHKGEWRKLRVFHDQHKQQWVSPRNADSLEAR